MCSAIHSQNTPFLPIRGVSLSVNFLRREVAGISGLFVAHRLEDGQILP